MNKYKFKGNLFGYVVSFLTLTYFITKTDISIRFHGSNIAFWFMWLMNSLTIGILLIMLLGFMIMLFNIFFEENNED